MKGLLGAVAILCSLIGSAQPDTLWVPTPQGPVPFGVVYPPVRMDPQYTRVGTFAFDTTRTAVELGYKRGTPSGIYRAYYPDGRPLIFAVYGWGWPHGDWTEYDELGSVSLKGQYRQGERDGPWAFRKEGIQGHYKKGLKHGKWKTFENGKPVRTEKYRKDRLKRTRNFGTP
jgi:hypothetical protein